MKGMVNYEIYDERTGIVVAEIVASWRWSALRMVNYLKVRGMRWGYFACKVAGDKLENV